MSRTEQIGWFIAGLVGVIIFVVNQIGGFGDYGWCVITLFVGASIVLFFVNVNARIAVRRTHTLRQLASELNLEFTPVGHEKLHQSLERFHLASLGHTSSMTNLMFGQRDGTDIAIFDYQYLRGTGKSCASIRQTVLWMQRRGTRMTQFALRPETAWDKLGSWVGHGDINFESHPRFSATYLLRGDDENAIRELFTCDVLQFYEQNPGLITEGAGNKLLFYRDGVVVQPHHIRTFLDEGLSVRSLFQPSPQP